MSPLSALSTPSGASVAAPTGGLTGSAGASLGRDEFLQLLVAQLRNQDPTNPQNGHEFAAQLAQFSSVEQLIGLNTTMSGQGKEIAALAAAMEGIRAGQTTMSDTLSDRMDLQSASALIGRTVQVRQSEVAWSGAGPVPLTVDLSGAAREVEVVLRGADGEAVRTLRTGSLASGTHELSWDGTGTSGAPVPPGTYTVEVRAVGPAGGAVEVALVQRGLVERLTVDGSGVSLWIDGRAVPFDRLLSVEPSAQP